MKPLLTIEDYIAAATKKGGKCLMEERVKYSDKIRQMVSIM